MFNFPNGETEVDNVSDVEAECVAMKIFIVTNIN
jgi:hypothetical protein